MKKQFIMRTTIYLFLFALPVFLLSGCMFKKNVMKDEADNIEDFSGATVIIEHGLNGAHAQLAGKGGDFVRGFALSSELR